MSRTNKFTQLKKSFLCAALLSTGWQQVAAQESPKTYSLETCISLAMQNNLEIANDELAEITAKYKVAETRGALLPRLDFNNQYQYYVNLPEQYAPASAFGGPEGEYTRMSLNMPQTLSSMLQLSQPLVNKELKTKAETSALLYEASFIRTDITRESVKYHVTATYYSIQVLQENLDHLKKNIINLEKTSMINEVLEDNELIAENVQIRLRVNIESLRNEYENHKVTLQQNVTLLKYLMHVELTDSVSVQKFQYDEESMTSVVVSDFSMRPDLRMQRAQVGIAQQELKSIHARYAPVVTASFGTGFTGYNDEFAPYRQINGDLINGSYFMVQAKVPLFAGFQRKHQASQQKLTIQKTTNTLSMMEMQAEKEVIDARNQLISSQTQLINTKHSLDLAQSLFDSAQGDYENGISTMTDLLNAQNDLTNARTQYSAALLNLKIAELSYKKAYGIL